MGFTVQLKKRQNEAAREPVKQIVDAFARAYEQACMDTRVEECVRTCLCACVHEPANE